MKKIFTEEHYPLKDLTEKIIAAAFKVHNTLGSGFVEKVYENALVEEFKDTILNNRNEFISNIMRIRLVILSLTLS